MSPSADFRAVAAWKDSRSEDFQCPADRLDAVGVCRPDNFISTHGAIGGELVPCGGFLGATSGGFLLVASAGEIRGNARAPISVRTRSFMNALARHTDSRV